jgi:hypothetical protein
MNSFDIIARLERSPAAWVCIRREAADEIRKLRKENDVLRAVTEAAVLYCTTGQDRGGEKLLDAVAAYKEMKNGNH